MKLASDFSITNNKDIVIRHISVKFNLLPYDIITSRDSCNNFYKYKNYHDLCEYYREFKSMNKLLLSDEKNDIYFIQLLYIDEKKFKLEQSTYYFFIVIFRDTINFYSNLSNNNILYNIDSIDLFLDGINKQILKYKFSVLL